MEKNKILELKYSAEACPIRHILDKMGDKWSMLVLFILDDNGSLRFNELNRLIEDISQKSLTVTLRSLEADGYISRKVYAEVPPRVEYKITELGQTLMPHLKALVGWSSEHYTAILANRAAYHKN